MVLLVAVATGKSLEGEDDVVVVFERPARSPKDPVPRGNRGNNVRNSNVRLSAGSGSASVSIRQPKTFVTA